MTPKLANDFLDLQLAWSKETLRSSPSKKSPAAPRRRKALYQFLRRLENITVLISELLELSDDLLRFHWSTAREPHFTHIQTQFQRLVTQLSTRHVNHFWSADALVLERNSRDREEQSRLRAVVGEAESGRRGAGEAVAVTDGA